MIGEVMVIYKACGGDESDDDDNQNRSECCVVIEWWWSQSRRRSVGGEKRIRCGSAHTERVSGRSPGVLCHLVLRVGGLRDDGELMGWWCRCLSEQLEGRVRLREMNEGQQREGEEQEQEQNRENDLIG